MITSIGLKNFKCFDEQTVACSAFTLLSGLNGMGKSSVLQALLLLRQSHQQGLLRQTGLALNGDYVRIGNGVDALFEGAAEDEIGVHVTFDALGEARWRFRYDRTADVMALSSPPVAEQVFGTSLFGDAFQYLQAERLSARTTFETSDFQVRQHKQLGGHGEFAAHYLSLFGSQTIPHRALGHVAASSMRLLDQVEAWMGEISPGTRIHITPNPGTDLLTLQYSFVMGKQVSDRHRATNVGFGLTYVLPIIVASLTLPTSGLLMIENPEAHLHPRGQAIIGRLLSLAASVGIQVIIETHSDHVLNGLRVAIHDGFLDSRAVRIHYFGRSDEEGRSPVEVTSLAVDSDGRIDRWPHGFFDEWDASLERLLEPRSK